MIKIKHWTEKDSSFNSIRLCLSIFSDKGKWAYSFRFSEYVLFHMDDTTVTNLFLKTLEDSLRIAVDEGVIENLIALRYMKLVYELVNKNNLIFVEHSAEFISKNETLPLDTMVMADPAFHHGRSWSRPPSEFFELFPALRGYEASCPVNFWECGWAKARLDAMIVHLNDAHKWTRHQIADWIDSLDIDIEAKV